MFNFTTKQPTTTTATPTTSNWTFTFNRPTGTQPQNVFGTNQFAPAAQPTNTFPSNLTGTTVKFNPVSSQAPLPAAPTTTNIFGGGNNNNTATVAPNPFGTNLFKSPSGPLTTGVNIFPPPPVTTSNSPWTTPAPNLFSVPVSTVQRSPFDPPANTNTPAPFVFGAQPNTNTPATFPFGAQPNTNTPATFPFGAQPKTNTPATFPFGAQPNTTTNAFTQPTTTTTTTFFNNTAPFPWTNVFNTSTAGTTVTPVVPGITSTAPTPNIFPGFTTPTTNAFPAANNFIMQPTVPTTVTTSNAFIWNPSTTTSSTIAGTQPTVTSSASILLSAQPPKQEQTASITQQNFLTVALLDPYANRGKKDFTNLNQIQAPVESTVVSTVSTSTTTTTAPIPSTIPIQTNLRKVPASRSSVDVNFKLRPVSPSPTLSQDIEPLNQPSKVSTKPAKSTLAGNFTDEEELILLGRTKMSKLRISNDTIDAPSRSNSLRSLYPIRRLAELEKFTNMTPRSATPPPPTTTAIIQHERTSHSANNSRDASPDPRFTPTANPKQQSSPIVQRKSSYSNNQNYSLPILTRQNYYMKPNASELKTLFNNKGECILKQFTVGHEIYGSVTFYGQINVAGLNLDEIIKIQRHEVTVYPDDTHKPSVGEELNIPARITLLGVYPTDRTTREEITDSERIKAAHYNDYLREVTKKFDGEFINYDIIDGSWTFMVKHFTRYGLDDEQDGFVIQS